MLLTYFCLLESSIVLQSTCAIRLYFRARAAGLFTFHNLHQISLAIHKGNQSPAADGLHGRTDKPRPFGNQMGVSRVKITDHPRHVADAGIVTFTRPAHMVVAGHNFHQHPAMDSQRPWRAYQIRGLIAGRLWVGLRHHHQPQHPLVPFHHQLRIVRGDGYMIQSLAKINHTCVLHQWPGISQPDVAAAVAGVGEIGIKFIGAARNAIGDTLKATGAVAFDAVSVVQSVVKGTVSAAEDVSLGLVGSTVNVATGLVGGVSDVGGKTLAVARDAVSGTAKGVSEVGGEVLTIAQRAALGTVRGVSEVGGELLTTAQRAVSGTVHGVSDIGAEVASVAKRAVHGGIDATREIAVNVTATSRDTVGGAIDTVRSLALGVVGAGRDVLVGAVGGLKDVLNAALPRPAERP